MMFTFKTGCPGFFYLFIKGNNESPNLGLAFLANKVFWQVWKKLFEIGNEQPKNYDIPQHSHGESQPHIFYKWED